MKKVCVACGAIFPVSPHSRCPNCRAKYRSAINQGQGWAWRKIRAAVLAAEPLCRICRKAPAAIVDHIVPRALNGGDEPSNLQPLCHRCHGIKTRQGAT